ncbi:hypothetical protein SM0020_28355 [Sinorhizobium meliloti CCNWSX0020]|uniref:Uncharacterized protein n=1 Tax=Sinorhizobium meliloti CCNWSX0020 TaxID=1107881 RepID=H0G836_RHIML|nr:hypothetical protein SM0020_28355 [Sinorhizobium meliloti CCNWSX0020]
MLDHHQHPEAIMPDSINLLDEVLTQLLTERGLDRDWKMQNLSPQG